MDRQPGLSVRWKLAISYAGFLMLAGVLLVAVVWLFLLRYVPERAIWIQGERAPGTARPSGGIFIPGQADLWAAFAPKAGIALALLLVFGLVGGWFLAGRMLAPLTRISAATRAAGGGSLSHRIRLPGRRDEFRELADAFDGMLARLEAHVTEQQRFAANASHELRTPLTITQTLLDVARADPDHDPDALVERLRTVNARAIELTEALLLLSRADRRSFTRERVDLSLIAEEAAETLLPLAGKHGVTVETTGELAPAVGSPALLLQVATNLLHNAIVHNHPQRGSVWIATAVDADSVMLTVENTGDVLSSEPVATLTEPFRRGTARVHSDHAHAGLGLAIVNSVTQAHDGSLTLTPRPGGGLRVTVRLPRAPEAVAAPGTPSGARPDAAGE